MNLTIKRFADEADVGVETVRFYQRKGLLEVPEKENPAGGIRRYGEGDVRRLRFIRKAQRAGFTLEEIKTLIELDANYDHERAHAFATARLRALDAQISELEKARASLRYLAEQCKHQTSGPCPIIAAFEA
ncbi:MerR family transcriptional regulator [Falsirhodobacter xinxiangensis]|uniref:MerR family transcriptional regulator n=1 Tax=Falsirhodobacter xinxiangensis TaxID=2530049 RepID=UPI0010AB44AC|nr:MerR family transcriptional regulator [Rhodobacter xinxiangensis]